MCTTGCRQWASTPGATRLVFPVYFSLPSSTFLTKGVLESGGAAAALQAVRCCRGRGVAGGERVPPSPLGWYLILILMSSLTWFICSYNCLLELRLAIRIWQSNIDQCDNLVQGYFMKNKRLKSIIALIFGVVFIFQFVFLVGVWVCFSLYPLGWAHSF